jgi:tripartite-type tricarboxylate transporter receptor subunit TctC
MNSIQIEMGTRAMLRKIVAAAFILMGGISGTVARADSDMFAGKTITYVVATKPGGGYDAMGRLVAKYLELHLTGSQVTVKNVPGAGHLIGAETIYASEPDGLTIGTFNTGLIYSQLRGSLEGRIDFSKFSWIGKAASESRVVMVAAKSDLRSVDDFKRHAGQIKFAVNGKGSPQHFEATMIAKTLGWDVKVIFGYEGTEGEMSLLRGEVDAIIGSRSSLQSYVDNGQGRFVLEVGGKPDQDVTQFEKLATTEQAKAIVNLIYSQSQFARVTAGPPGIPEDRLKVLRSAYMEALTDPSFIAEAKKAGLDIDPAGGEDMSKHIDAALKQPAETIELLNSIMGE